MLRTKSWPTCVTDSGSYCVTSFNVVLREIAVSPKAKPRFSVLEPALPSILAVFRSKSLYLAHVIKTSNAVPTHTLRHSRSHFAALTTICRFLAVSKNVPVKIAPKIKLLPSFHRLNDRLALLLLLGFCSPLSCLAEGKEALRVLRDECLHCHKPGKAKGGLLLHTAEKMHTGGDSGKVVLPGRADDSLLYQVVLDEGDAHMPPKKQLPAAKIAALKQWINAGAPWDESVFDEAPAPQKILLCPLPPTYQPVLAIALSPDEKQLAIARANVVVLLDLSKPERPELGRLEGHPSNVQSLVWTPDGRQLISGSYQKLMRWDATSRAPLGALDGPLLGDLTALAVDTEGKVLYAADAATGGFGFIHQFDLTANTHQATWKAHDDTVYSLRISSDNAHLLSGSADKLVKLWDRQTHKLITLYEGHTNHVLAVDFNKDGTRIATAGADREVKIWDSKSREQIVTLGNKKNAYTALDWTPDGKTLAVINNKGSGSVYSELKVHDGTESGRGAKELALESVDDSLTCVSITADATTIYAGGFDGEIHAWKVSSGKLLAATPKP